MTDISYESLIEKSLLSVTREALLIAAEKGLGSTNHFYISFQTQHPGAILSERLKISYPEEMTIVLQHEYTALEVTETAFSVTLSFNNVPERITIPFIALTRFADPYAQFALSFNPKKTETKQKPAEKKDKKTEKPELVQKQETAENVVSLSAFRKKK